MNVCKGLLVAPADSRHLTFAAEIIFPDTQIHITVGVAFPGGEPTLIMDSCHPLSYTPPISEIQEYIEGLIQDLIHPEPQGVYRYDIICREGVDLESVADLLVARIPSRTDIPRMRDWIIGYLERCERKGTE